MDLLFSELINRVRADGLRNEKSRRIKQKSIINSELAADRRFDPQTEPDSVTPDRTKICCKSVVRRCVRRIEKISDAAEDISAVVERHGSH